MDAEHRDAIKAANRRRSNCAKCGASSVELVDGKDCGGMPGIAYKVCRGCGHVQAKPKTKLPKEKR